MIAIDTAGGLFKTALHDLLGCRSIRIPLPRCHTFPWFVVDSEHCHSRILNLRSPKAVPYRTALHVVAGNERKIV